MITRFLPKLKSFQRADTIVEVMISLLILSMTLTTVYYMGNRSLHTGTDASQRTEATSIAQGQIDLLINAKNNDSKFAQKYQIDQPYCINQDGSVVTVSQSSADKLCDGYNGSNYNVGVSYSGGTFTITTQWQNPNGANGVSNLNLYYKLPGSYTKALVVATTASVKGSAATINGTVNPNGSLVSACYFNVDTSTSYSNPQKIDCKSLPGGGNSDVAVSADVSNLASSTTYYFQLCAVNQGGAACSVNNGTFTTKAAPSVINESASKTQTSSGNTATLNAQVNPNGFSVTGCYFEWGTSTSYGSTHTCGQSPGSGTDYVQETQNIANLDVGVTYHFRLVATNVKGTTYGADSTFQVAKIPITLSVTPTSVPYGGTVQITWSASGALSCTANSTPDGAWSTNDAASGSATSISLTQNTAFSATCTWLGGATNTSDPVTVSVAPLQPPAVSMDPGLHMSNVHGHITPYARITDCYFYNASAYYESDTAHHVSCLSQLSTDPSTFQTSQQVSGSVGYVQTNPYGYNNVQLCAINAGGEACSGYFMYP